MDHKINIPTDRRTWEDEIATYWFENGVLISLSKSPRRTIANTSGNVSLVNR
ncbi:MAG: hypothetical protein WAQ28_10150 [Bacteroidia bacterium]|jgi:hypothetical protein